jgi:hypothetical protein
VSIRLFVLTFTFATVEKAVNLEDILRLLLEFFFTQQKGFRVFLRSGRSSRRMLLGLRRLTDVRNRTGTLEASPSGFLFEMFGLRSATGTGLLFFLFFSCHKIRVSEPRRRRGLEKTP